jgi:hypothetical protein
MVFGANSAWDTLEKLGKKFKINMYKLERKESLKCSWYEVMLSPFKKIEDANAYHMKYSKYYPHTNTTYRLTNLETGGIKIIR